MAYLDYPAMTPSVPQVTIAYLDYPGLWSPQS